MTSSSEAPAKAATPQPELRKLGKYELQRQLGAGGMGTVYLAKDTQLKRLVALKVLPSDKAKNPTLVRRFNAEAQASAQLRHDNIVAVFENGEADGRLFIAMEYVDGTDLHELIRKRGKIPIKRSLEIIKQVAKALEHAGAQNIVHRDIKPSNLLIRNDGAVKLTDLGLARSIDDTLETDITRAGTTVGTVDYMSPEQGRNSKLADSRSDIYSLGCTWFHMLTGRPPYPDGSMTNKLQAHATKTIPDAHALNENVTEGMSAVLQRMMAKKPEDRYQTPAELLKDLNRPSLTRGGVVEEVLSAIAEDTGHDVATVSPEKKVTRSGVLPPKQKTAETTEEERSILDWETIQPFLFAVVILLAIVGLGIVVASYSGGLDFGMGKITRPNEKMRQSGNDAPKVVVSQTKGDASVAQSSQTGPVSQNGEVVATNMSDGSNPAQPTPTTADGGSSGTSSVTSPNNPGTSDSANPGTNPGSSPSTIAQGSRTFDPESVPAWSAGPSLRNKPNGGSASSGAAPNSPGSSNTPTTQNPNPSGTQNPQQKNTPGGTSAQPSIKTITVGSGIPQGDHFRDLAAALRSVPKEGAVIKFTSPGPFLLPDISLRQIQRLTLIADDGQQPVIVVRPADGQPTAGLQLAEGVLEMEGLHFTLDRSVFPGSDPVKLVTSTDGQLTIRQCTFTVWGSGNAPVRAIQIDSQLEPQGLAPILEPRILIDEVVVRGDQVTALAIARANADVVVRESLFAVGHQPAVTLSGKLPDALAATLGSKPRRAIRFLQSTLFGQRMIFQVNADGMALPPATVIFLQESVCATNRPSTETILFEAAQWPQTAADAPGSKLVHLNWGMKDSVAFGFSRLGDMGSGSSFQALQLDGWSALWKKSFAPNQFAATAWPAGGIADLSTVSVKNFDRETLPAREILRADNSPPGCEAKTLPELSSGSRRWLTALAAKPTFPASPFAGSTEIVKIDISKQQDLGGILATGNWPSGTVLELTGSGLKSMTPVKLVNKNWKIVWRPQEGAPLMLTPKVLTPDIPAIIVVERGSLELENIRFQLPASKKTTMTSMIAANGARLYLENVSLQGIWSDTEVLEALVSWTSGPPLADGTQPYLACRDSLFASGCAALRLDMASAPVYLRNCLMVQRTDALQMRFGALPAGQSPGPLVADHLTISAGRGAFHLRSLATGKPAAHRFYVDQCVFAPPVLGKHEDNTTTLFSLANPDADLNHVEWWGTNNGVAPEIVSFIRSEANLKATASEAGIHRWQSAWAAEQDQRLLSGPGGVILPELGSVRPSALKPSLFALHDKSKAKTWDDGNLPIGADVRQFDLPPAAPKPKETPKKTGPTTTTPVKPQADF